MTKWLIRAVHEDGFQQISEIETDVDIPSEALSKFEAAHGWVWANVVIDRMDD